VAGVTAADVRIVFMGSPAFAVPSLRALVAAGYPVVASVSQPDRPAGRGGRVQPPLLKVAAQELGIETFQPETLRDPAVQERLSSYRADVFCVAAYGKILPAAVLAIPSRGCLNVHASLLPRWRGPSPIAAAILAGDAVTGVSIMELVLKMDAGPVILRSELPIEPGDTAGTLESRLAELGANQLVEVLPGWLSGALTAVPQDESGATYCRLISKADGQLKSSMTAIEAERAVRAYNPWPKAFVHHRDERLAIWAAHVDSSPRAAEPGTLAIIGRQPAIAFAGGWLVLEEVQRAGSRRLSGQEFFNGERGSLAPEVTLA
jgi:methionyl-tRNA formyltransferase